MFELFADEAVTAVVGWALAAVAAAIAIWKGWPVFKQVVTSLYRLVQLVNFLTALDARLAAIEYELKPNGGGSLHDKVTRTESRVGELGDQLEATDQRLASTDQKVEGVAKQARSLKASVYNTNRALRAHINSGA